MAEFFDDLKAKVARSLVEKKLEDAKKRQKGTPMGKVWEFTDSIGLDTSNVLDTADKAGCGVDDVLGAAEKIGLDGDDICKLAFKGKAGTLDAGDIVNAIGGQKKDNGIDGQDVLNFFSGNKKEEDSGLDVVDAAKGMFGDSDGDKGGFSLGKLKELF